MYQHNDGGRADAGYRGDTRDCVCRAIAIALEKPYQEVYAGLISMRDTSIIPKTRGASRKRVATSHPRTGVNRKIYDAYLKFYGWEWTPTMHIGSGCKVHLKASELPNGRIIARCSRHVVAVVDGIIQDTYDCSRGGTRCVYGYYKKVCACPKGYHQIFLNCRGY